MTSDGQMCHLRMLRINVVSFMTIVNEQETINFDLRVSIHTKLIMQNKYNQNDVSILLPDIGSVQTVSQRRFLRRWNQLSRLQRTFVYVVALAAILLLCFMLLEKNKKEEVTFKESLIANITVKPVTLQIENDIQSNEVFPKTENRIPHKFTGPTNKRQEAVVRSFQHAWSGYKTHAWGHDNLKPITGTASNWFTLGLTIVDSLDTAYIMGLKKEFGEGKQWIADELSFDLNKDVNFFEVTIRVLGALLANYQLTFEEMFLQKAIQLGDKLLGAFNSGSGIPYSDVNLATKHAHSPDWSPYSSTAEVTTVQLEFRQLSRASGDSIYEDSAARVSEMIHQLPKKSGLVPIYINPTTGKFLPYATVTLGARGDSYYEYLLKQWIQTGKTIDYLLEDYVTAIEGVREHLAKRSSPNRLLFIGELTSGSENFSPKMDHLTCFLPGTLALGVLHGLPHWHMKLAEELMWTCYQTYAAHPTFLAPEITHFNMGSSSSSDMYTKAADSHSLLRPEFVESLWYMYQITGNTTFQDWGWQIYEAFEKYAKVERGYTSLNNVRTVNTVPRDMMESFFLSETLKYLYLLFSDDRYLLDLKRYVINTEAHPLPIHSS